MSGSAQTQSIKSPAIAGKRSVVNLVFAEST
jgi:hypothetical protein